MNSLPYWNSLDPQKPVSNMFRLYGECMLLTIVVGCCSVAFGLDRIIPIWVDPKDVDEGYAFIEKHWFIFGVLIAPLYETMFLQWLPFEVTRRFTKRFWPPFLISWFVFAILHFCNSVASGLAAGIVGGFYLALTYSLFRGISVWRAFGATYIFHAAHNFIPGAP